MSFVYVLVALPLTGLLAPSLSQAVEPAAILSGLMAPIFALTLATFVSNKVEGLTLMKGLGILMLGPLAAYFVDRAWQPLFGILPPYWSAKTLCVAGEGGNFGPYVLAGAAYNLLLTALLLRRFREKLF